MINKKDITVITDKELFDSIDAELADEIMSLIFTKTKAPISGIATIIMASVGVIYNVLNEQGKDVTKLSYKELNRFGEELLERILDKPIPPRLMN